MFNYDNYGSTIHDEIVKNLSQFPIWATIYKGCYKSLTDVLAGGTKSLQES